jgi:hypothetical protein
VDATAGSLSFSFKPGKSMANITICLLNNIGQILAKEVAIFGQTAKKTFPLIRNKNAGMIVNFMNKLF